MCPCLCVFVCTSLSLCVAWRETSCLHSVVPLGAQLLPCEERDVQDMYEALLAKRAEKDVAGQLEAVVDLFHAHPFVRNTEPKVLDRPAHTFTVTGFSLNVRGFQKWLKGHGRRFKGIAGGVSDDGLYTVSGVLRGTMPRGFHVIKAGTAPANCAIVFGGNARALTDPFLSHLPCP